MAKLEPSNCSWYVLPFPFSTILIYENNIIICFVTANKKSGNNEGAEILSSFRRMLNPAQVTDLSERDPVAALEWCRLLGDIPYKIVVAGGDGTVAWLLDAIHKLQLNVIQKSI